VRYRNLTVTGVAAITTLSFWLIGVVDTVRERDPGDQKTSERAVKKDDGNPILDRCEPLAKLRGWAPKMSFCMPGFLL
jgi:hypothetical protein